MSTILVHPRARRAVSSGGAGPARVLLKISGGLSATVGAWIARSQQRRALRELAECSDRGHLLDDIGLTPEDARRASAKWFWQP
jgi:uncharacterized protein YjiS (DUF1127 family)